MQVEFGMSRRLSELLRPTVAILALGIGLLTAATASAQSVVQEFFVPMPEDQVRSSFLKLYSGTGTSFDSVISIVVNAAGTRVVYDHWEDGYEIDLNAPAQSTTRVWGDGNNANGIPPGYVNDPSSLAAGAVIALRNLVNLPRNPATVVFDGRDRIASTKAIVISRSAWATTPGSVLAGAVEMSSTLDFGTRFVCPVGENVSAASMFEVVDLYIQASENGTAVSIDKDANGSFETVLTLNRGESYRVNGGVFKGANVVTSKPVQVHVLTGDIDANYECDWFTLYPYDQWTSVYYTPVGTANDGDQAYAFIYNPGVSTLPIRVTTQVGQTNFTVAANGTFQYQVPKNSGARFEATNGLPFFAIETVGANPTANNVHDWGFTLVPEGNLTTVALVGWGPGSSDLTENGSPVWVTAVGNTTLYVDYNGDRLGSLTDPNGEKYDVAYSMTALQSQRIFDPDKDQTAMRVYTLNGVLITAAWGQDPATAGPGNPFLDLGTTIPPFPVPVIRKSSVIAPGGDVTTNGISVGDTLLYTVEIDNRSLQALGNVIVLDAPPPSLSYVTNSSFRDGVAVSDNVVPPAATRFPFDEAGYVIPVLPRGTSVSFTYKAVILSSGSVVNGAGTGNLTVTNTVIVPPPAGSTACALDFTDAGGGAVTAYAIGGDVYVTLADRDANVNTTAVNSVVVTIQNSNNGDIEQVTLAELSVNTNLFRNTLSLPTSVTMGLAQLDGVLNVAAGDQLSVSYIDPVFADGCSDTATIATPSAFKTLYLSTDGSGSPDQDLDRIDPVFTNDATTASTVVLGGGGGGGTAPIAVTFDNSSTTTASEGTSGTLISLASVTHVTTSEANRLMLVGISSEDDGTANLTVTQVTYTVNFVTQSLARVTGVDSGGEPEAEIWSLVAPNSGTGTVRVAMSSGTADDDDVVVGAATFYGVNQTTPLGNSVSNAGTSATATLSIGSATNELVFDVMALDDARAATVGAGQAQRWNVTEGAVGDGITGTASTEPGATNVTMSWSLASDDWGLCAVTIKPVLTGPPRAVATTSGSTAGAATSLSISHTTGSGPNGLMVVGVGFSVSGGLGAGDAVTNVYYGSQNLTRLSFINEAVNNRSRTEVWYLRNPPAGTANVFIGLNASRNIAAGVTTFTNVHQTVTFGTVVTNQGTAATGTVSVVSATNELVYNCIEVDDGPALTAGAGQSQLWQQASSTEAGAAASTKAGSAFVTNSWTWPVSQEWSAIAMPIKPAAPGGTGSTGGTNSASFTQTPALCSSLSLPAGGTIIVTNYITVTSGTMTNLSSVTARLHYGTNVFFADTTAVYATGGGVTTLTWSAVLPAAANVPAGQSIVLDVSNNESSVAFTINFDSTTKPSKVILPTTSLITIDSLSVYDAPYPGGSLISSPVNGDTLYVRATVSDPFGAYDITDLDLVIDGPGGAGDISTTLTDANVATNTGCSKIYQYVWHTGATEGSYSITAVANEGTEGVTDTAATSIPLTSLDLGTPCELTFTFGNNGVATNTYGTNSSICVRVSDLDQNTSPASNEIVFVTLTTSGGDSEFLFLLETGTNTGVFASCIPSSTSGVVVANGVLNAPFGTVITANYVDPTDSTDPCSDTATVPPPGAAPAVSITKTLLTPSDGQAQIGEAVQFRLRVVNTGSTTLNPVQVTDTWFTNQLLYVSTSPVTNAGSSGTAIWTNVGPISPGANVDLLANFTARAVANPSTNTVVVNANNGGLIATNRATVLITRPLVGISKVRVTPPSGPVSIGSNQTYRIVITNTGSTAIGVLPLEDTFSGPCFSFVSSVPPADGVGFGSLFWTDITGTNSLAAGAGTNVDVTLRVNGGCDPADNLAAVNFAVDVFGDSVPPVNSSVGVTTLAARVTGTVYNDPGGSGTVNGDEIVMGGVSVGLYTDPNGDGNPGDGALVSISVTLTNGTYEFGNLSTGRYVIVETDPSGFTSTGDTSAPNDNRIPVFVNSLTTFGGNNFLDRIPPAFGTVRGQVRLDTDSDGNLADPDRGIADVSIQLVQDANSNGVVDVGEPITQTVATDTNGNYTFSLVVPGNYVVREIDPNGLISTKDTVGANDNQIFVTVGAGATSSGNDFLDALPGSIGDRVWLDENSDGVQDAGESGIANVTMELVSTNGVVLTSTATDSAGRYRFNGLGPATYTVRVVTTSLASGLVTNQTFDPDATTNHQTSVALAASALVTTADFGYNWAPRSDTGGGSGTGAIGDRVWVDADGDGRQDPDEPGLAGVAVTVLADLDSNGTYTDIVGSTVTDGAGSYIFDGLAPGAYVVRINGGLTPAGYTATGDPDGTFDNRTTSPVLLAPGDVYVNADFGYQPTGGTSGSITGTVWLDADADAQGPAGTPGGTDTNETTREGITVALIRDTNGNGAWNLGEPIIAATLTDPAGVYVFAGLPIADGTGTDDYLVLVNDVAGLLAGSLQTYDSDGLSSASISAVSNLTAAGDAAQDFGYTAAAQRATFGFIGDNIFLDRDADGVVDAGEGLGGVTVRLYTSAGVLVGETATPDNGFYGFGGLSSGTYTVRVDTATLPGTTNQLTNTTDPDGGTPSVSTVTIGTGQVNLAQDFGYRDLTAPNTIAGTLWDDADNDGLLEAGETNRYAGVSVVLRDSDGSLVARTITAANGNYTFSGIPDGTYSVDVTDIADVLRGAWHSTGATPGADNNSQNDPYTLSVAGGATNSTGDFGYFRDTAELGDRVWDDTNANGIQDVGEFGISNVVVVLTVGYPIGVTGSVFVATDVNGNYRFRGLLLDEDVRGIVGSPAFNIQPVRPTGYTESPTDQGGNDTLDSDPTNVVITVARGVSDFSLDYGFYKVSTVGDFTWEDLNGDGRQDVGEPGISNVVITLYKASNGNVEEATTSQAGGAYQLVDVKAFDQYIIFTLPAGYVFTSNDAAIDVLDSDANPVTGQTLDFSVSAGSAINTIDAGFYRLGSIRGSVLLDVDGDGMFDVVDTNGIAGVTVNLLNASSNVVATTTTAASGAYNFTNLPPGSYTVVETDPAGYISTADTTGANDNRIPVSIISGQISSGNIFLDTQFAGIGNFTWIDSNGNGQQDGGEPGLTSVVVRLITTNNTVLSVTTSSVAGAYGFTNVLPGTYSVEFVPPGGYLFTTSNVGSDLTDSDPLSGTNRTAAITLTSGQVDNTVDAGFDQVGTISGSVLLDVNGNGVPEGGDTNGIGAVTVRLFNATSNLLATTTTAANGSYSFIGLLPGVYVVVETDPAGYVSTFDTAGANDNSIPVILTSGQTSSGNNFMDTQVTGIGDFTWVDSNGNGQQDGGEPGLSNVVVQLISSSNTVIATSTTSLAGAYTFTNVPPGTYTVAFTPPAGYLFTTSNIGSDLTDSDPLTGTNRTAAIALASGQANTTIDAGFYLPATIGGFVRLDVNGNGVAEGADTNGIGGVTVSLQNATSNVVATTSTAANGSYNFTNLLPGSYTVVETDPAAYISTADTVGANDNRIPVTLTSGQISSGNNFLNTQLSGVGDFTWVDSNGNGQQDGGEPGLSNVVVRLINTSNTVVAVSTSSVAGAYSFTNVPPGSYAVEFAPPGGYLFTTSNVGSDLTDSDPLTGTNRTATVTLVSGQVDSTVDAGFYLAASISGSVLLDVNGNGVAEGGDTNGIGGVTVTLQNASSNVVATTTTTANGAYSFTNLPPGSYTVVETDLAGYISTFDTTGSNDNRIPVTLTSGQISSGNNFLDTQVSGIGDFTWIDTNGNGQQDGGEPGLSNVVVQLISSSNTVIATSTTSLAGAYTFTNVPPGTYTVAFTPPAGYLFTTSNIGSDLTDSDPLTGTNRTAAIALASGQANTTIDAGFYLPATIGGFVRLDVNGNGVAEGGDTNGIGGVTVSLQNATSNVVATTSTAANGSYSFTNLPPGSYTVVETDPAGYISTADTVGANDNRIPVTLTSGQISSGNNFLDTQLSGIGDFTWVDSNGNGQQDGGEPGLSNVVVRLINTSNTVVAVSTSSVAGAYSFTNVPPGSYVVEFTPPAGYLFTTSNAGSDLSDSDPLTGTNRTATITLVSGQGDNTVDAGFYLPAAISGSVLIDANGNGVQEGADTNGIGGVTVRLLNAASNVVATTTTAANGTYNFTGLAPGAYTVVETDPAGYISTGDTGGANDNRIPVTLTSGQTSTGNNFLDVIPRLESYRSNYTSITNLYYRDPELTGQTQDVIYVGGPGFVASTNYYVAYFDAQGLFVYLDTTAYATNSGFLRSVNPNTNSNVYYGTWTAIVIPAGASPQSTAVAQATNALTIVSDTFDVVTWSTTTFIDATDNPTGVYGSSNGTGVVYMRTVDRDQNQNTNTIETITVTLTNAATGDSEPVTLYETGPNTGVFANNSSGTRLAYPISSIGATVLNNGILSFENGDSLQVLYVDPNDPADRSGNISTTHVLLAGFAARRTEIGVVLEWITEAEQGTIGFDVLRREGLTWRQINRELVAAVPPSPNGGTYYALDRDAPASGTLTYTLVEHEAAGGEHRYGPFKVTPTAAGSLRALVKTRLASQGAARVMESQLKERAEARRLRAAVPPPATASVRKASIATATATTPMPRLKIETGPAGVYVLTAAQIATAVGMDQSQVETAISRGLLRLSSRGLDVAWRGAGGQLSFYAETFAGRYATNNVYWLERGTAKRGTLRNDAAPQGVWGFTYPQTTLFEQNHYAPAGALVNAAEDFWMWDYIIAGTTPDSVKRFGFDIDAVNTGSGTATLSLRLAGSTKTAVNPDHHVLVAVNGQQVGESRWDGIGKFAPSYTFSSSLLREGHNELTVTGVLDAGRPYSIFYLNNFDVTFPRYYGAHNGVVTCAPAGNSTITVENFQSPDITVLEVTDWTAPVLITGTRVEPLGSKYRITFAAKPGDTRYFLSENQLTNAPVSIRGRPAASLITPQNSADYLVIAPSSLMSAVQPLADRRSAQGLQTRVIDLEDVYDNFTSGFVDPEAIRQLLRYAVPNWTKAPRYVLLAGAGTYDTLNYLGYNECLIPALAVSTPVGILPSDSVLGDVNGDNVPEVAVGRLPVISADELATCIRKIVTYEDEIGASPVLMTADNAEIAGNFPVDSRVLGGIIAGRATVSYLDLVPGKTSTFRNDLFTNLRAGRSLMGYAGHGGTSQLANEGVLRVSDVAGLNNANQPTVLVGLSCLLGHFAIPGVDTLGEALVTENNGAAAVWAPAGLAYNNESMYMGRGFYGALSTGGAHRLGDATLAAHAAYAARGSIKHMQLIYNLLGDPAMRLGNWTVAAPAAMSLRRTSAPVITDHDASDITSSSAVVTDVADLPAPKDMDVTEPVSGSATAPVAVARIAGLADASGNGEIVELSVSHAAMDGEAQYLVESALGRPADPWNDISDRVLDIERAVQPDGTVTATLRIWVPDTDAPLFLRVRVLP